MNQEYSDNQAQIVKSRSISPVWFLPIVAVMLGAWFLFQNITNSNVQIKIHFDRADSIIVDKTKIRYKGVIIGTVKKIELDAGQGVNVMAEIESHAKFMLREQTQFWLVSPKATLTSISGLDTLFSGSYINLSPGDGEPVIIFNAVSEQPIIIPNNARLITLQSDSAGSINVGTPLFYKKIQVGEIERLRLDTSGKHVNIKAFVDSKYSHLVKEDSKFWNISGLRANISTAGIDVKLDSITSLIAGGVTFSSPDNSPSITDDFEFKLFDNIDESQMGLSIELLTDNIHNLPIGAGILFKGHGIGRITDIQYSLEKKHFIATATINPEFTELVTQGAQFWLEKTSITFSKIKNLGNIITGDYIAFKPVSDDKLKTSKKSTQFVIQETQKPLTPGLTLVVLTNDATGLNSGDPIHYNGIKIGEIKSLDFSNNSQFIETRVVINYNYQYLINKQSQFYLLSGINFKASLKGLEVQSTPMENIISGGIGLYNKTPIKRTLKATALDDNQRFRLYPSKALAKVGKNSFSKPLLISLLSKQLPSISIGSPVYYQKLPIGEVSGFNLDDSGLMKTNLSIKGQYQHLISRQSVFWNISGFNVDAGFSGIKVQAESLLAIASGGIAVGFGAKGIENMHSNGHYKLFDNHQQATNPTTRMTLTFNQANDLQTGSKLRLKGLVVGEVEALKLTGNNKVQATIALKPEFSKQIARKGSRFWMIRSDVSLAGAKNLSTLITGVYINVSLGKGEAAKHFIGEDTEPLLAANKSGLPIILLADNAGSTDISSPVYHRQIKIGEVIAKQLTPDASGVEIIINIYPKYSHLIRENSIFWPASGFNLNIGITGASLKSTSLTSLIKGGINMSTPDNTALQPMSDAFTRFKLKKQMNENWLDWKLSIPKP